MTDTVLSYSGRRSRRPLMLMLLIALLVSLLVGVPGFLIWRARAVVAPVPAKVGVNSPDLKVPEASEEERLNDLSRPTRLIP